jgi:hypothetical protein
MNIGDKGTRPSEATAEYWETIEKFLEVFDNPPSNERTESRLEVRPADPMGKIYDLIEIDTGARKQIPGWFVALFAMKERLRGIDWQNKDLAALYLRAYAGILGPESSIDILRDSFGPAVLRERLNKKRGPTNSRRKDDCRIRVYIDAIMWDTGDSVRTASRRLAKMGLMVRKDGASERGWVALDNPETIRKRYMRYTATEIDTVDTLRLKLEWHRSGEPPFLKWLKGVIANDSAGPI